MQYKTIVYELLQGRATLHERLRQARLLRPTVEAYARHLKDSHESWTATLAQTRPGSDPSQTSSEALELAVRDLEESLPADLPPDGDDPLTLEQALAFLRRPSPRG